MEIKRCPFCGGEWGVWVHSMPLEKEDWTPDDVWSVECGNCGARTDYWETREEAIERWNRRVEDERSDKP